MLCFATALDQLVNKVTSYTWPKMRLLYVFVLFKYSHLNLKLVVGDVILQPAEYNILCPICVSPQHIGAISQGRL
jgi:hypothetical protein